MNKSVMLLCTLAIAGVAQTAHAGSYDLGIIVQSFPVATSDTITREYPLWTNNWEYGVGSPAVPTTYRSFNWVKDDPADTAKDYKVNLSSHHTFTLTADAGE